MGNTKDTAAKPLAALTQEELTLLLEKQSKELAEKDVLIGEQAALISKLETKLDKADNKPMVDLGKKGMYTVNSGANWAGKDYSAKELADNAVVCAEILKEAPTTPIFTKED